MSEDHSFNRDQKKKEESKSAPDFCGSSGRGMLAKESIETLGNSSGLTPLSFGVDVRNKVMEMGHPGDGLSPLRPFGEFHISNMKRCSLGEGLSADEGTETPRDLSGLSPIKFTRRSLNER